MRLRYFFDWGGDFLWSDDEEAEQKYGHPADIDLMPLSDETRAIAARLGRMFEEMAAARSNKEIALVRCYYTLGEELYRRLTAELGPNVDVVNELRPSPPPSGHRNV